MAHKNQELDFHLTLAGWSSQDVPLSSRVESWRLNVYQETLMVEGAAVLETNLAQLGVAGDGAR